MSDKVEELKQRLLAVNVWFADVYRENHTAIPEAVALIDSQAKEIAELREALEESRAEVGDCEHAIRWLSKGVDFERTAPNETRPTIRKASAALQTQAGGCVMGERAEIAADEEDRQLAEDQLRDALRKPWCGWCGGTCECDPDEDWFEDTDMGDQ